MWRHCLGLLSSVLSKFCGLSRQACAAGKEEEKICVIYTSAYLPIIARGEVVLINEKERRN
jgi:hypothetical protein